MENTLTLTLGPLADPISKQLAGHGDPAELAKLDRIANAISHLHVLGFIPENVAHKARKKLMNHTCKVLGFPTR